MMGLAEGATPGALLIDRLAQPGPFTAVELRPPASGLGREAGIDAWIDLHHALNGLSRRGVFSFLTDNAVGFAEEESLAHVGANVGREADLRRIVPILTAKHTLDYCRTFASRAVSDGFDAVTVTGGDLRVGRPRCVPHGSDLRAVLRDMGHAGRPLPLALGGWVNPHKPPDPQLHHVTAERSRADFALTQIVSHHSLRAVESFLHEVERRHLKIPMIFGVFFYRSANPRTLSQLEHFFPVPAREITAEFDGGVDAHEICAKSLRGLRGIGVDRVYVSNLSPRRAALDLRRVLELV